MGKKRNDFDIVGAERMTVTESNSSHAPQKSGNLRVKQTKIDHSLTALVKARNALWGASCLIHSP